MAFETLSAAGFEVTLVDRFDAARARLMSDPPAVLLTAIKLGEFNGLHLVLAAKTADPRIAAIVTIDPRTGYIEAMASSGDYGQSNFNLAAQGHRRPGSTFKVMALMTALRMGVDFVALSFVRSADDVAHITAYVRAEQRKVGIR